MEDWSDWLDVPKGKSQIWTGHDPECSVTIDNGTIKIWHDKTSMDQSSSIEFSVEEMIKNLKAVEKDLRDFLVRLAQWTKNIEPKLEEQVVNHFAKHTHIKV